MEERSSLPRWHGLLAWLTFILMLASNYMIFQYAPLERVMREVQKIFYVHVGLAWNAFLAFAMVFVASVAFLMTREERWDALAEASAEIGVLFTTLVLITGPIWGRSAWNTWWTWEPRLTTTLILWFIYLAYLLVRGYSGEGQRRPVLAAVFGIIGFLDVPLVYFSVYWWRLSHPIIMGPEGGGLEQRMLQTLIVTVLAFTALYAYLIQHSMAVGGLAREVRNLKDSMRQKMDGLGGR